MTAPKAPERGVRREDAELRPTLQELRHEVVRRHVVRVQPRDLAAHARRVGLAHEIEKKPLMLDAKHEKWFEPRSVVHASARIEEGERSGLSWPPHPMETTPQGSVGAARDPEERVNRRVVAAWPSRVSISTVAGAPWKMAAIFDSQPAPPEKPSRLHPTPHPRGAARCRPGPRPMTRGCSRWTRRS